MTTQTTDAPIVTIYGDHGPLVAQIVDEIRRHGASTHTVSVESGWLSSVARGLVLVDSPAGLSAIQDLCDQDAVMARIVVLLTGGIESEAQEITDRCVDHQNVTVLRSGDEDLFDHIIAELVGTPDPA